MVLTKVGNEVAERVRVGACDAVLIAGPTASGKSAFALFVAEAVNGTIINADSMQVYRDLRVLSARPTAEDEARREHRLYGHVPATLEYSVGDYLRDAAIVLADVRSRGLVPVFVGGTGLYFRALTEGLVATPEISEDVRARVAALAPDALHDALAAADPATAQRLHPADAPRLMRALEVFYETGQSLAHWQAGAQGEPLLAPGRWTGMFLAPERASLVERIDARFIAMMEQGALDEVRRLLALGLPVNRGVMKAHGVPHLARTLAGEIPLAEAIALGQGDTRRYAKRQITWARKFMAEWQWLPV